ncbi:MAG: serine hydrolase [Pseudomonadales bacterium]|nr:serine hydrolase [Pseudomonadales bacterium]
MTSSWSLRWLYAYRLVGSQLIAPVTRSSWYQPRLPVPGGHTTDLPRHPDTLQHQDTLGLAENYLFKQRTRAFLLLQDGQLIHAAYRNFSQHGVFNSMSMFKTVIALAVGIALEQGILGSVHDHVAKYLPEWSRDRRSAITIEHLLTMQSGLKSDLKLHGFSVLPLIVRLYLGTDLEKHALALPAVAEPGRYFEYNNYNTQILGLVLERASGINIAEYLATYLWQPLGCKDASLWLDKPGGKARTFGAMFASPEDWLRVGQLFLTGGAVQGRSLVPSAWLDTMKVPRNTPERGVRGGHSDYGYQLWLKAHDYGLIRGIPWFEATHARAAHEDSSVFYLEGMRGQYLFISPRHQLVMLRMGERPARDWDGSYAINLLTGEFNRSVT